MDTPSTLVPPSIVDTFGALLIGSFLSSILFGLTSHQAYRYYRLYPNDSPYFKWMVSTLWLLDAFHSGASMHACYFYLVTNYFRPENLETGVWSMRLLVGITSVVTMITHCFFARRVYKISGKNMWLTVTIVVLASARFALGIAAAAETFIQVTFENFSHFTWLLAAALGSAVGSDVIITVSVSWFLHKSRTGYNRTDSMIDILQVYTINTGLITSVTTVAALICAIVMPNNLIYLAIYLLISKLYPNSLLAVLNSRRSLQDRGAEGFETGSFGLEKPRRDTKHPRSIRWAELASPTKRSDVIDIVVTRTKESFQEHDSWSVQNNPSESVAPVEKQPNPVGAER